MAHRWGLLALALIAAGLHAAAVAQTLLPAQDGLKFIRIARQFQVDPWSDVVRGSDAHPLYPALIAVVEPVAAGWVGRGPDAWRIAAQVVSAVAAVGLMFPIYFLTRSLFDRWTAILAAVIAAFLPRVAELGRDTLADSLGLFLTFLSLSLGARALRNGRGHRLVAVGSGLAAGAGYLARPEVILVPGAIGLAWLTGLGRRPLAWRSALARLPAMGILAGATLALVGSYALVKGELSEKIAVRRGAALGPQRLLIRAVPQQVPPGLDDPQWDFSPKEESDHIPIADWRSAASRIGRKWWEELCWFFAVMAIWGLVRRRSARSLSPDGDAHSPEGVEGRLLLLFTGVHAVALVRHCAVLGYLSGRHVVPLVLASVPWAAGGMLVCGRTLARSFRWSASRTRCVGIGILVAILATSALVQLRPTHLNHLSRWGHWAAGQWLSAHARPDELILDTRGWARFLSGRPGYDYWHVRQALTDSHLAYVLVGLDELDAGSPRAATLRTLLAYAATPLADFFGSPTDRRPAVRLYRFQRPSSWEGLAP